MCFGSFYGRSTPVAKTDRQKTSETIGVLSIFYGRRPTGRSRSKNIRFLLYGTFCYPSLLRYFIIYNMMKSVMGESLFRGNGLLKMMIFETKYHKNLHFLRFFIFRVFSLFVLLWCFSIILSQNRWF